MKMIASFSALALLLALVGCGGSADGPSDEKVKEVITRSVSGNMSAFCHDPEVESVEILKRGEPQERRDRIYYPIRIKVAVECGSSMLSKARKDTLADELSFWQDGFEEWKIIKTPS